MGLRPRPRACDRSGAQVSARVNDLLRGWGAPPPGEGSGTVTGRGVAEARGRAPQAVMELWESQWAC